MILLLFPLLPINPRISSQLTVDEIKNINGEQEKGNRNRKFGGNIGNYNNYNKITLSTAEIM